MKSEPRMVYVHESLRWEYKQIVFRLDAGGVPSCDELDSLGAEGWELAATLSNPPMAYLYFKRTTETKRRQRV